MPHSKLSLCDPSKVLEEIHLQHHKPVENKSNKLLRYRNTIIFNADEFSLKIFIISLFSCLAFQALFNSLWEFKEEELFKVNNICDNVLVYTFPILQI